MPKVDESLVGFSIEVCFEYDDDDDSTYYAWCDGVVHSIVNKTVEWLWLIGTRRKFMRVIQMQESAVTNLELGVGTQKTPNHGLGGSLLVTPMLKISQKSLH
jgi:hypothetical protein